MKIRQKSYQLLHRNNNNDLFSFTSSHVLFFPTKLKVVGISLEYFFRDIGPFMNAPTNIFRKNSENDQIPKFITKAERL